MTDTAPAPDAIEADGGEALHRLLLRVARHAWEQPFTQAEAAGLQLAEVVHRLLDVYPARQLADWLAEGGDGDGSVHVVRHWDRKWHAASGEPREHSRVKP